MERQEQLSSVCAADNHWYCGMERPEERSQFQQNLNLGRKNISLFLLKKKNRVK